MFLSWPFNFFIYVNTNLYQKYQKMTRNMKKISVASKIGILPILQEFPPNLHIVVNDDLELRKHMIKE